MRKLLDFVKFPPERLHELGSNARENDDHLRALQYLDHAIVGYQKEGNFSGLIDALKDRTLTWKHYFILTKDSVYAILAKKDAESMLEIAREKHIDDKLSTSYFRLGEVAMLFENYFEAVGFYENSLKYYKGSKSEKGDFRYHLGEAFYRDGRKVKGKRVMLEGLKEIRKGAKDVPDFLIHVWESGCYMRLAELLYENEPNESKKYLDLARRIINGDKRLVIRKRQLKELTEALSSRQL